MLSKIAIRGITACVLLVTPILIGVGAAWKERHDTSILRSSHQALEAENASYRSATEALAGQIESLQAAIADLVRQVGVENALDQHRASRTPLAAAR